MCLSLSVSCVQVCLRGRRECVIPPAVVSQSVSLSAKHSPHTHETMHTLLPSTTQTPVCLDVSLSVCLCVMCVMYICVRPSMSVYQARVTGAPKRGDERSLQLVRRTMISETCAHTTHPIPHPPPTHPPTFSPCLSVCVCVCVCVCQSDGSERAHETPEGAAASVRRAGHGRLPPGERHSAGRQLPPGRWVGG